MAPPGNRLAAALAGLNSIEARTNSRADHQIAKPLQRLPVHRKRLVVVHTGWTNSKRTVVRIQAISRACGHSVKFVARLFVVRTGASSSCLSRRARASNSGRL